ncbi:glycosyl transferase family 90 [Brucella gallinifaecis]|uniref:Lipopolysaccharide biosynthesis protein n=1 Tax=Brucella gallinifaecis TaxID=215590 RepID=A0A502BRY1_9HYPH|nr:glycosyl transferase family 90 [Brucella gallinifaecis]TPF76439.1 lipopolysaccharide biosynthesis protein [Brucella gallinifaecis]
MRPLRKVGYYISNFAVDNFSTYIYSERFYSLIDSYPIDEIIRSFDRLNYYNKLSHEFSLSNCREIGNIEKNSSMYYYDLKEYARFFPKKSKISYVFGDITEIPATPSIVKSRPINGDNSNSVILNLDKFRHYYTVKDRRDFRTKLPKAVWRGRNNNSKRLKLVESFHDHPLCDVGLVHENLLKEYTKPWLSLKQQLQYRYIISVEGRDVATNLKWIMSSKSLCMMPKCIYETWFMEGRLIPGFHFVLLNDDFSDLPEKIEYYNKYPLAAEEIINNANDYCTDFFDKDKEKLVSLLVLMKYFYLSGQIDLPDRLKDLRWC